MLFRFIASLYLKLIFTICLSLQFFFMCVEIVKYADDMPDSANLVVLLFAWIFSYALNFTLPIALILASVASYIILLRTNNLTAILSIGYSKKQVFAPLIIIATLFSAAYVTLFATPFVYAEENIQNIIYRNSANDAKSDLLVKHNENYVYMQKVFPLLQKAQNIKVFEIGDFAIRTFIEAKDARFDGEWWILDSANITQIPSDFNFSDSKLTTQIMQNYKILQNFKPKILDTIYQNRTNISIVDAFTALNLLHSQNSNTEKIRAILYGFFAIPLAIPLVIMIMAHFVPPLARYTNLAKLGFIFTLFCLIVWGVFFMLTKLALGGLIQPEFGILAPLAMLMITAFWWYQKV
ncbi:LptF/LptG family permease [Helicobacter sp. 23-1044]